MNSNEILHNTKEVIINVKSKHQLENLKSKYILKKVFNLLQKKKLLEIIKYNKKIQQKLNINFNDYKVYSELYSSIEIEVIPVKNKYGEFINIDKKKDEKYYHIHFNNNKEEIKRTYLTKEDKVSKINITIDYQVKSINQLFYFCENIESINFKKFSRNNINNMSLMFFACYSLKEINFTKFNTDNVIDMSYMFRHCLSLKKLDLSKFNTENVVYMIEMFFQCSALQEINLSSFNTIRTKT